MAVATAANWFAAWLVSQFFLSLVGLITEAGTFWLFAGFCAVTYVFVLRFVPETKGRSLEEVERLWGDKDAVRRAIRYVALIALRRSRPVFDGAQRLRRSLAMWVIWISSVPA